MSESDAADSTRLGRRLRILRVAILAWLALVLGRLFLLDWPFGVMRLPEVFQLACVALYLGAMFLCRERPGLAAVASWGGLLCAFTVVLGWRDMDSIHDTGWRPIVWLGLLAFSQLTIVLAAVGAWLLAPPPSGGATPYLVAFLGATAVVVLSAAICTPLAGRHPHTVSPEHAAIRDIRTMISAESAYQSANGGFYDVPECLFTPQRCIPAYPANAPTFIDPLLGQTTVIKSGYRRVFHPGPPADAASVRQAGASASSLLSWAYTAVPLVPGETGARGFCGDGTGIVCFTPDGQAPGVENGLCAASCQVVQ
jgi:hypothetical protein